MHKEFKVFCSDFFFKDMILEVHQTWWSKLIVPIEVNSKVWLAIMEACIMVSFKQYTSDYNFNWKISITI